MDDERYSSWNKLISVTNLVLKFIKIKCPSWTKNVTAGTYWLKRIQMEHFPIIRAILLGETDKPVDHPSKNMIGQLNLYLDELGLVRSKGRVANAEFTKMRRDPILSTVKAHSISLYIKHVHEINLHSGEDQTLATVRQVLWVPHARPLIKRIVKGCVLCRRYNASPLAQPGPPQLPFGRVNFNRPFQNIGVDYSGALIITDENTGSASKVYVCLITCMASRAVHLELAKDNSAAVFVNLFRRFVSSWGLPCTVTSDNAANFTKTSELLETIEKEPEVRDYFRKNNLVWRFIHARSPWEGGFYERLVGVVKRCIHVCMHLKTFTYDDMVTLLKEAMARINNRPLTYIGSSLDSLDPLTPNHLLFGHTIDVLPPIEYKGDEDNYLPRSSLYEEYEARSARIVEFIKVWEEQYLQALRARHQPSANGQNLRLKVGDIVIVESPVGRATWPLGRVLEINKDPQGIARSAVVLTRGLSRTLTLNKLVSLEVEILEDEAVSSSSSHGTAFPSRRSRASTSSVDHPEDATVDEADQDIEPCTVVARPRRRAAIFARKNIRSQALQERKK